YGWAVAQDIYGLETSPFVLVKPTDLVGPRVVRHRTLDERELAAFWSATKQLGYPTGPLYQLLVLTGTRLREWANARWREVDLDKRLLVLGRERVKSDVPHVVPLCDQAVAILESLPRQSDFVFTTTGTTPAS